MTSCVDGSGCSSALHDRSDNFFQKGLKHYIDRFSEPRLPDSTSSSLPFQFRDGPIWTDVSMLGAYEFTDPFQVLMRCTGCCETRPDPIEGDVGGTSACVVTCHFTLVQHQCLSITNPRMLTNLK